MSRPSKPVELRPVDDLHAEPEDVARLTNNNTDAFKDVEAPVVLGQPAGLTTPKVPVKLPMRVDLETRSQEPCVETIMDLELPTSELLEDAWENPEKNAKPIAWGWFALLAIIMISAVIWSLANVGKSVNHNRQIKEHASSILTTEEEEERNAAKLIDKMDALIRDFHNASSISTLLPMVRHPERVKPLMEHYYGSRPVLGKRLRSITAFTPLTLKNRADFWMVSVKQSDDTESEFIIQINEAGDPLIDWETYVRYQSMDWPDYVKFRPDGISMDFRVNVRPDNFFSNEFSNSSDWACYQLNTPDSDEFLYGYVRADSPLVAEINDVILRSGREQAAMILKLHIPQKLESKRGVIIEKLVCDSWLLIEPPAPES